MKYLFMFLTLLSFSSQAAMRVGQVKQEDCDGTCGQQKATGAEGAQVIQAAFSGVVNEEHRQSFCGAAASGEWRESIVRYAQRNANIPIENALSSVNCVLARGTSENYIGNMLHTTVRKNPHVQNITTGIANYLLRENPTQQNRRIFVGLIKGVGDQPNIFHQLRLTWKNDISRKEHAFNSARVICLSIDRFNVDELKDIRENECMTAPFNIPRRT